MKKNLLFIMMLLLLSCGKEAEQIIPGKRIILDVDAKDINEKIKQISVLPFEADDSWKYISSPLMTKVGDTFVFCTQETQHLLGYREDGKKVFSRHIKGRGRGEVLGVNNIYTCGDTVCLFDVSKGGVVMFDKEGKSFSRNDGPFVAEYLYPLGKDRFVGLTSTGFIVKEYVTVFDDKGKSTDSYLTVPGYLKNQSMSFGQTPMSYCYKDSVRFMIPYDYNIYSVSEGGIESVYQFVPENPIPQDVLEKMESDLPVLEKIQLVGRYDDDFQSLFEMDRYLYCYYSRTHVLYDKLNDIVFKTHNPETFYQKESAPDMVADDVWRYAISSFLPLYSEGNCLYGRLPRNFYNILNDCSDRLDSRLTLLKHGIDDYFSKYELLSDDVIIVRIDFE